MTIKKSDLERYIKLAKAFYFGEYADAATVWDEFYDVRRVVFGYDTRLDYIVNDIVLCKMTRDTPLDIYCEIFKLLGFEIVS